MLKTSMEINSLVDQRESLRSVPETGVSGRGLEDDQLHKGFHQQLLRCQPQRRTAVFHQCDPSMTDGTPWKPNC